MIRTQSLAERRLSETGTVRFLKEYFGNTAWFPIANTLLEILLEGASAFIRKPDFYAILFASLLQALFLSRRKSSDRPMRLLGNLIGPAIYTFVEILLEGTEFFQSPNHIAYWGFSLAIGMLQEVQPFVREKVLGVIVILENLIRTSILLTMYIIFEFISDPEIYFDISSFLSDSSHQFISLAIPLLGISLGVADLTARRYLSLLSQTSSQLKIYAEWLLGRDFLDRLIVNPDALSLTRRERTVLFMDIRGFTAWSEKRTPEEVVGFLNRFYTLGEEILTRCSAIKFKYNADEIMAVFSTPTDALQAAQDLRDESMGLLDEQDLGAGIGVHTGPLVEGLLGSTGVRFYDVIGDTVNTAQRLESAAAAAEIICSESVRQALPDLNYAPCRQITVKGKQEALKVYPLLIS